MFEIPNDPNEAIFGVIYNMLDFEDFDAYKDAMDKPGKCQNRNENDI